MMGGVVGSGTARFNGHGYDRGTLHIRQAACAEDASDFLFACDAGS